jgi:hypothetical protein
MFMHSPYKKLNTRLTATSSGFCSASTEVTTVTNFVCNLPTFSLALYTYM